MYYCMYFLRGSRTHSAFEKKRSYTQENKLHLSDPSNKIKISQNQVYESIIWDICFVTVGDIYVCVDIDCIGYISNNFVVVQNDSKCPTVKSSGLCASSKFTISIFHPSVTLWTGNIQKITKGMFQKKTAKRVKLSSFTVPQYIWVLSVKGFSSFLSPHDAYVC